MVLRTKVSHGGFHADLLGKSIFLTREEAEAALEAQKNTCDEWIGTVIRNCRKDGMSEEEIQKWLKET